MVALHFNNLLLFITRCFAQNAFRYYITHKIKVNLILSGNFKDNLRVTLF